MENKFRFKLSKLSKIMIAIIVLAFCIRLIYIIRTPYMEKQHDIEPNGNGLSYIFTIYNTGRLPDNNGGQNYHPPLHQILAAGWLKIISIFSQDYEIMCESLQFLTLIYSMLLILVLYKIIEKFRLKDKYKILLMIIFSFHPMFIILSGTLNNDILCLLLVSWSILRLIDWYYNPDIKNTIFLAIAIGLSVMAKTSGAIIALPTIYIFLLRMIKDIKKTSQKRMMFEKYVYLFVFFGCISLPIGLWYPIRNYLKFYQPILYIMDVNNADLYVGNNSLISRLTLFSSEIFKIYCDPWVDFNIPTFLAKCSLFEEYSWGTNFGIIYSISIVLNIIMILVFLISFINCLVKKEKRNIEWKIAFTILLIFNIISYLVMNIKLPYGCSMNFRYLLPTIFIGAMFTYFNLDYYRRKNIKLEKKMYKVLFMCTVILFMASDIIILFS